MSYNINDKNNEEILSTMSEEESSNMDMVPANRSAGSLADMAMALANLTNVLTPFVNSTTEKMDMFDSRLKTVEDKINSETIANTRGLCRKLQKFFRGQVAREIGRVAKKRGWTQGYTYDKWASYMFSWIHSDFNDKYEISSYVDLLKDDYAKGVDYIQNWMCDINDFIKYAEKRDEDKKESEAG